MLPYPTPFATHGSKISGEPGASCFLLSYCGAAILPIDNFGPAVVFQAAFCGQRGVGFGVRPAASSLIKNMECTLSNAHGKATKRPISIPQFNSMPRIIAACQFMIKSDRSGVSSCRKSPSGRERHSAGAPLTYFEPLHPAQRGALDGPVNSVVGRTGVSMNFSVPLNVARHLLLTI